MFPTVLDTGRPKFEEPRAQKNFFPMVERRRGRKIERERERERENERERWEGRGFILLIRNPIP
jgi:hypothetical protein